MTSGMLSIDRLRELLGYDPDTGVFTWKIAQPRTALGAVAGYPGPGGRLVVKLDGHMHYLTRLAWAYVRGVWPIGKIVQLNEVRADVRFENLAEKTQAEVSATMKVNTLNKSGHKGVSWSKSDAKWVAMITRNGRQHFLGKFETKEEAAAAYGQAAATGVLPGKGSERDPNWKTARRQRSAPWKDIQANPQIVGWNTLEEFVRDVGEPPTVDHMLMRERYDEPLGPGNAMWRLRTFDPMLIRFSDVGDYTDFEPLGPGNAMWRLQWSKRAGHEAEPQKSYNLMQFDISVDEYNRLMTEQDGLCAICRRPESSLFKGTIRRLAVDHDHETGDVRGLLCGQCNNGLGRFDDDPLRLRAAAEYLEAWAKKHANVVPLKKDAS